MKSNNIKQTYICILRGVNVGGYRKIAMKDLKLKFEEWGFEDVSTYIQSGNIVFRASQSSCDVIAQTISHQILKTFSLDVPVIVKTGVEWEEIVNQNPFINKKDIDYLHITFFQSNMQATFLNDDNRDDDEAVLLGSVIYLYCPNGYGKTKLTNTFFENKLKTIATTRNLKTVLKLLEMALTISSKA